MVAHDHLHLCRCITVRRLCRQLNPYRDICTDDIDLRCRSAGRRRWLSSTGLPERSGFQPLIRQRVEATLLSNQFEPRYASHRAGADRPAIRRVAEDIGGAARLRARDALQVYQSACLVGFRRAGIIIRNPERTGGEGRCIGDDDLNRCRHGTSGRCRFLLDCDLEILRLSPLRAGRQDRRAGCADHNHRRRIDYFAALPGIPGSTGWVNDN